MWPRRRTQAFNTIRWSWKSNPALLALFLLPANGQDLKSVLARYDDQFLSAYSIELESYNNVSLLAGEPPEFAMSTVRMTGKGQWHYAVVTPMLPPELTHPPKGAGNTSDGGDTNHRVLFPISSFFLFTPDLWKQVNSMGVNVVQRSGEVVNQWEEQTQSLFQPGSEAPSMGYFRYLMALGRGYSQRLDTIESVTPDAGGIAVVLARGHHFFDKDAPWRLGQWRLEIDTRHGYLVRLATFVTDQLGQITTYRAGPEINDSAGNLPLYKRATISKGESAELGVRVRLRSFSNIFDAALPQECDLALFHAPRDHTVVYDHRNSNCGGVPSAYR